MADAARILNQMMIELGFGAGYIAQGGDWGACCRLSWLVNMPDAKHSIVSFGSRYVMRDTNGLTAAVNLVMSD